MVKCIESSARADEYEGNPTGITLCINEVLYANLGQLLDCDGYNSDWIELYNYGSEPVSLKGLSISDHIGKSGRWFFPDSEVGAGEYLIVFASGKDKVAGGEMHTDFLLGDSDTITLYDSDGRSIDQLFVNENVDAGVSVGRLLNKPQYFALLSNNSPGAANRARAVSYVERFDLELPAPVFSADSGIYEEPFDLYLEAEDEGATILYTLDGSDPDMDSLVYERCVRVGEDADGTEKIANAKTTAAYDMNYMWENTSDLSGTVVKARTMKNGALSDKVVTKSYLFSTDISFDIISLTVDPDDLFDENSGIYVPGDTYYYWKRYNKESTNTAFSPGNYDSDERVKAYVEIFDKNNEKLLESNAEIEIMGAVSRALAAKGLKVTLDGSRGVDAGIFELFPEDECINDDLLSKLAFRPAGSDFNRTMFCDILAQKLSGSQMNVTYLAAEPAVLFINGQYWGIHNIREVYDAEYFYRHYGIEEKNLALIKLNTSYEPYSPEISEGSIEDLNDYNDLIAFMRNNDLEDEDNYRYVCDRVDIDNLIDYYIAEMYFANTDWPGNNFRIWRANQAGSTYGDGRWRFVFYDIDNSMENPDFDNISYMLDEDYDENVLKGGIPKCDDNRELLYLLIRNPEFSQKFFDRFEECLDGVFSSENVISQIDELEELYAHEMENHFSRWHTTDGWLKRLKNKVKFTYSEKDLYTCDRWKIKVEALRTFAKERPEYLREFISQYRNR